MLNKDETTNSYIKHARAEFMAAGWTDKDGNFNDYMQQTLCKGVEKLLEAFCGSGHSGFSAPYAIKLFSTLARFEPISPLTGEDSEWDEVSDGDGSVMYQNNRFSAVFKNSKEGKAYWVEGRIFREPNGECYTNGDSHVEIEFPWTKTEPEYVDAE